MAVKKAAKELHLDEEAEGFAYFLSYLVSGINPKVDKGESFNIISEMLARIMDDDLMSEKDAIDYGKAIAKTTAGPDSPAKMH